MIPRVVPFDDPEVPRLLLEALETGLSLIFPTDTVYGVGGNPWDERVLDAVRRLKGRDPRSPFTLHLPDTESIGRFARPSTAARHVIDRLLPGPFTFLLPASPDAPPSATKDGIVGVRVPDHPFFGQILARLGRPIFGTSVNRSGEPPAHDIDGIIDRFGAVDLVFVGPIGATESTILDLTVAPPRLVRGMRPDGL